MPRRTILLALASAATLLSQFADCMSAMTQDNGSMQCCASMPCNQGSQHDCCQATQRDLAALPANPPSFHITALFTLAAHSSPDFLLLSPETTRASWLVESAASPPLSSPQ